MTNEHILQWANPTAREDGTPYDQSQNAGYEIQFDGTGTVSVPLAYGTSFDLATLAAYPALKPGTHQVGLAVVDTGGLVSSFATISFSVFSASRPLAPTALALA